MASCRHIGWLHAIQGNGINSISLEQTDRLNTVIRDMPDPETQIPQFVFFLGRQTKDEAMRHLYPRNNLNRRNDKGYINLRVDNESLPKDYPVLLVDSDPFEKLSKESSLTTCHETRRYSPAWPQTQVSRSPMMILYSRLISLFSDVVCIFADDFLTLDLLLSHLQSWVELGSASTLPLDIRPKLLIIISEDSSHDASVDAFGKSLETLLGSRVWSIFSSIKIFRLAGKHLSNVVRYQRLRYQIRSQLEEMRTVRRHLRCLFSALHLSAFFQLAVRHTITTTSKRFDFLHAARLENPVASNFQQFLQSFLRLAANNKVPYGIKASYVASSIMMDAYPPQMHLFDPTLVYKKLYQDHCMLSFNTIYDEPCSQYMNDEVRHHFEDLFGSLDQGPLKSSQLHKGIAAKYEHFLRPLRSNQVCLACIRRYPERHLSCGHSFCDSCVCSFGVRTPRTEKQFKMQCIFNDGGECEVNLKPNTAGVRLLGIDGGGARGVTPLEFMTELQRLLGDCPLYDLIDLALGTSSGGLTVLAHFHQKWAVSKCAAIFETLATRCFSNSGSLIGRLKSMVNYITTDAMYNEGFLEGALQESFRNREFFGFVPGVMQATKVAVTATSGGNTRAILANYNGPSAPTSKEGYSIIRPDDIMQEPLLWQAARATTAAPIFFKPITIDDQEFWDGGLGFSNPIELATWEARRIWSKDTVHDVTLSLGTGEVTKGKSKSQRSSHSVQRLWASFMDFLDGHTRSRDMTNCLSEESKNDYFRLDTQLPSPIRLDDVKSLQSQKENIHINPSYKLAEVATALLVSNFFFTLDIPLRYQGGFYFCQGSIRCRTDPKHVFHALEKLHTSPLEFVTASEVLGDCTIINVCSGCFRYRKQVSFFVRRPSDIVSLFIQERGGFRRKISGFPNSISWFEVQQGFHSPFGRANIDYSTFSCPVCDETRKRKTSGTVRASDFSPKRKKIMPTS